MSAGAEWPDDRATWTVRMNTDDYETLDTLLRNTGDLDKETWGRQMRTADNLSRAMHFRHKDRVMVVLNYEAAKAVRGAAIAALLSGPTRRVRHGNWDRCRRLADKIVAKFPDLRDLVSAIGSIENTGSEIDLIEPPSAL